MEEAAAIFSLMSAFLAMKKNIHNWTIGIIGIILYGIIFWQHKLYADFVLQILFLIQSVQGIFGWTHHLSKHVVRWGSLWITFIAIVMVSYLLLNNYTQDPNPFLDSLAATLSLFATYLMIKKNIECWYFWIAADTVYIYLFYCRGLNVSLVLYGIFFILATRGYFVWKKLASNEKIV